MNINELFLQARTGDKKARSELFEKLTARFSLLVQHRISDQHEAEEIAQDSLATIAEKYENINIEHSFSAWAQKVLDNHILNYYRVKASRRKKSGEISEMSLGHKSVSDDPLFRRRLIDCFRKITKANINYARVLNLHFHGYKANEICGKLEISRNNLYSILCRARSLLMQCIEEGGNKNE